MNFISINFNGQINFEFFEFFFRYCKFSMKWNLCWRETLERQVGMSIYVQLYCHLLSGCSIELHLLYCKAIIFFFFFIIIVVVLFFLSLVTHWRKQFFSISPNVVMCDFKKIKIVVLKWMNERMCVIELKVLLAGTFWDIYGVTEWVRAKPKYLKMPTIEINNSVIQFLTSYNLVRPCCVLINSFHASLLMQFT